MTDDTLTPCLLIVGDPDRLADVLPAALDATGAVMRPVAKEASRQSNSDLTDLDLIVIDGRDLTPENRSFCQKLGVGFESRSIPVLLIHDDATDVAFFDDLDFGHMDALSAPVGKAEFLARVRYGLILRSLRGDVFDLEEQVKQGSVQLSNTIKALRESEERYRLAAQQAAIWDWNILRDKAFVSPRLGETLGYSRDEFDGIMNGSLRDIVHPDDLESYDAALTDHMRTQSAVYEHEHRFRTKSGGYKWFQARGQSQFDAEGKPFRSTGLISDIDDRKRTEVALRQAKVEAEAANQAKSQFLANMSHDLRTPLNAVLGFSEIMKFELFGEHTTPKYREYSEDIYTSGSILLALVSDLLDVSKIEVGGMELTESEVSLRLVVADCDRMFEHKVKNTGPELLFHVPEDIPLIRADSLRVRQIMVNLISNAIKFTPAGGRISVHAELSDDGTVVVVVNDTGIGIAVDELKSISEPFVRAGNLMDGRAEGSGLGLYLVKSLMEMHDGTLEIESTLGVGTTVTLTFPAARVVQAS